MVRAPIDFTILVLYVIGLLGLGYWGYRRSETLEDYLVAGRRIPLWMYVPVMSAVVLGGASTIGSGGLGYESGISGAWLVVMLGFGLAALGVLISTRLSNLKAYTLGEVLERRFDAYSGTVGAVIAGVYALTIAITQTIAIGKVLSALLGFPQTLMIVAAGVVVIIYTTLGGMWTVTITDFVQWVVMTIGIFALALPLGLVEVGGISGLRAELEPSMFSLTEIGLDTIFTYFLLYFLGIIIGQDIWQRVFTARDEGVARTGTIAAGAYSVVYGVATALLGMIALVLLPNIADPELALPRTILEVVPVGLSGLILAGFVSAMMSTADSALLASSTLLTNDIYRRFFDSDASDRRYTRVSRVLVVGLGGVMIYAAVAIGNVIDALTLAYDLLTGSIFVPIMGAFFWKRATWQGAIGSIVASGLVVLGTLWLEGFASNLPILYGLGTSLVVFVGVSYLTGPPPTEVTERWREEVESTPSVE